MAGTLTFDSLDDLEQFALDVGATVEDSNGQVFNSEGRQTIRVRRSKTRVERPAPVEVAGNSAVLEAISKLVQSQSELTAALAKSATAKMEPEAKPVGVVRQPVAPAESSTPLLGRAQIKAKGDAPPPAKKVQIAEWTFTLIRGDLGAISRVMADPKGVDRVPGEPFGFVFDFERNNDGTVARVTSKPKLI